MILSATKPVIPRIESNTVQNFRALRNMTLYGLTEDEIRIVEGA